MGMPSAYAMSSGPRRGTPRPGLLPLAYTSYGVALAAPIGAGALWLPHIGFIAMFVVMLGGILILGAEITVGVMGWRAASPTTGRWNANGGLSPTAWAGYWIWTLSWLIGGTITPDTGPTGGWVNTFGQLSHDSVSWWFFGSLVCLTGIVAGLVLIIIAGAAKSASRVVIPAVGPVGYGYPAYGYPGAGVAGPGTTGQPAPTQTPPGFPAPGYPATAYPPPGYGAPQHPAPGVPTVSGQPVTTVSPPGLAPTPDGRIPGPTATAEGWASAYAPGTGGAGATPGGTASGTTVGGSTEPAVDPDARFAPPN